MKKDEFSACLRHSLSTAAPHGRAAVPSAAAQERGPPGKVAVYCDRLFGRNKLRPSHGELPSGRRTAVERRPYRTIRNVPLRGATGSSQTESMEM